MVKQVVETECCRSAASAHLRQVACEGVCVERSIFELLSTVPVYLVHKL